MVSKRRRLMALILAVMTLISVMTVGTLSTSAAAGDTVYCENAANWSTVYCYMWGDSGKNAEWPGIQMTKGSDGLWAYTPTENWNNIIFNAGSGGAQTDDLTIDGNCFNNSTNSWSTIQGGDTPVDPTPTPTPTPTTPVTPTPSGDGKVYLKDTNNWGNIHVYMWNSEQDKNASWPGEKATSSGDGVYEYTVTKSYANIIFNNGSDAAKTGDLIYPGEGQIYDNGTGTWSLYDTSKLHIKSFTADVASPQYTGVKINLSAVAGGGEGELSYKFSVGSTVISDYSSASTCSWTPTTAGSYTVNVEVKDTLGETVSKSMAFEIKDIKAEVKPVIQNLEVSPSNFENTEIKKGTETTAHVTAGGGNTGTKLLFYKYTITDPKGETANVPYYTLKNEYKFTPASTGTYSVTATVQGSDNSITAKTVEYDCVSEFTKPGALSASLTSKDAGDGKYTFTAKADGGTAPYSYEFKMNGSVVQAASTKNTYTLTATEDGNYTVEVIVKDAEGATVTKSASVQVGGADDPNTNPTDPIVPGPTDPEVPELKAALAVEDAGNGHYKFTATATGGEGDYQYQFVANGYEAQKYSSNNTVTFDLSADGQYTIVVTVKDAKGTTADATKVITVSGGKVEMPLEVSVAITEKDGLLEITANAIGGEGDYQYEFLFDGQVVQNYSTDNTFEFGLPEEYEDIAYLISVNVKDGANTVEAVSKYVWLSNGEYGYGDEEPEFGGNTNPTTKPTDPVDPDNYLKGDADCDGKVNVKDATCIQKYLAKLLDLSAQAQKNAEVDGNGSINIKDATTIQKYVAKLIEW
ncbi:MAG: starch-binding protein [Ruminococcus sp.]|nr:starch-binding protein [Ruminococcus sp.]